MGGELVGLIAATGAASFTAVPAFGARTGRAAGATGQGRATAKGGYTFALDKNVKRTSVRFKNRYGIEVAADLYVPKNARGKLPSLAVSGPFGAVNEQPRGSTPTSSPAAATSPSPSAPPSPGRAAA